MTNIERMVDQLQKTEAAEATQLAGLQRDLVEIETQFCAEDQKIAIFHAYELRFDSMFFLKAFGEAMPIDNAVYPNVGKCAASK